MKTAIGVKPGVGLQKDSQNPFGFNCETADRQQLQQEIQALCRECAETELTLQTKLQRSKAEIVSILADSYAEVEQSVQKAKAALQEQALCRDDSEDTAEVKILLAEYALDFAHQAANRALLISLDAIDTQRLSQDEPERKEI